MYDKLFFCPDLGTFALKARDELWSMIFPMFNEWSDLMFYNYHYHSLATANENHIYCEMTRII